MEVQNVDTSSEPRRRQFWVSRRPGGGGLGLAAAASAPRDSLADRRACHSRAQWSQIANQRSTNTPSSGERGKFPLASGGTRVGGVGLLLFLLQSDGAIRGLHRRGSGCNGDATGNKVNSLR